MAKNSTVCVSVCTFLGSCDHFTISPYSLFTVLSVISEGPWESLIILCSECLGFTNPISCQILSKSHSCSFTSVPLVFYSHMLIQVFFALNNLLISVSVSILLSLGLFFMWTSHGGWMSPLVSNFFFGIL